MGIRSERLGASEPGLLLVLPARAGERRPTTPPSRRFRDGNLLRNLFETTVERYIADGLIGGGGFAEHVLMGIGTAALSLNS